MNQLQTIMLNPFVIAAIIAWAFFWKGLALWHAASKKHISWFILFLILNTVGILEICYVYQLSCYDLGSKKLLNYIQDHFSLPFLSKK